MSWLQTMLLNRRERITGENLDFMRAILSAAPSVFWRFGHFSLFLNHRKHCPKEAWHVARIAAVTVEDCGPCLQTCVTLARRDGVTREIVRAALDGGAALPEATKAAFLLGRAVTARTPDVLQYRDDAVRAFGEHAANELAVAIATVQVFPTLKRGLGFAQSCSLVSIDI